MNVTVIVTYIFYMIENIVEKGENAGYQHFLLFSQCFQKSSYPRSLKVRIVWERVKTLSEVWSGDLFTDPMWPISEVLSDIIKTHIFETWSYGVKK